MGGVEASTIAWIGFFGTAVGALVGAGSAFFTQWLTGRREQERERSRWRREEERQWLMDRREAYAELYGAAKAWEKAAIDICQRWARDGTPPDNAEQVQESLSLRYDAATGVVDLLAPETVRDAAELANQQWSWWFHHLWFLPPEGLNYSRMSDDIDTYGKGANQSLLQRMREDLGVDDVEMKGHQIRRPTHESE
jgi:hypothetical protein